MYPSYSGYSGKSGEKNLVISNSRSNPEQPEYFPIIPPREFSMAKNRILLRLLRLLRPLEIIEVFHRSNPE